MSDLFSRIAERALGLAPSIQPMVTPFFAPTRQQENSDLLFETLSDEAQSEERWQAKATTSQNSRDPERSHELVHSHEPERLRGAEHAHTPEQPSQPQHVHTPQHPSLSQHVHKSEQPSYPEHAPVPVYPAQPHHAHEPEQPSNPHHAQHEHTPEHRNVEYPPVPEYPRVSGYPRVGYPQGVPLPYTARLASDEPMEGGRANTADSLETSTRTQALSRQAERHANEAVPKDIQAAPTVHVTIGRIEVRATPASATQASVQRQQAAPKAMSLDEYLKQNGRGGGR